MCVGVNISEQIFIWKHQMSRLSGPREEKWGLDREKIKTTKYKKYNETRTKTIVVPPGE